jgi:hypothetical protein
MNVERESIKVIRRLQRFEEEDLSQQFDLILHREKSGSHQIGKYCQY